MNNPAVHSANKAVDTVQQSITDYAHRLNYQALSAEAVHAAKVRIIDSLGALIGGFYGDTCHMVRNLAAQTPNANGATVVGSRIKTTPDMAAFVNAITGCYADMTDSYHQQGSAHGHPSNVVMPVIAAAEHAQSSGRELVTAIALAYEVFLRISDVFHNPGFDNTNFASIANAAAAGKLFGLGSTQIAHAISMAAVPNVILKQARIGPLSMYYTAPAGHAGRAGLFAAMLARAGMEGPHLPFEGKAGWCEHVARKRFSLDTFGGNGTPFKVTQTQIKVRPTTGITMSAVLAAEKVSPLKDFENVKQVTVEVYKRVKDWEATYGDILNPDSRVTAYYSVPYLVAATLIDGTVTLRSYNDSRLWNPRLRALMQKIKVVANDEFTRAYEGHPQQHRMRVTVVTGTGEQLVGEAGGAHGDLAAPKSDAQIEEKFRALTEDYFGAKHVNALLDRLWHLEDLKNTAEIPPAFVLG